MEPCNPALGQNWYLLKAIIASVTASGPVSGQPEKEAVPADNGDCLESKGKRCAYPVLIPGEDLRLERDDGIHDLFQIGVGQAVVKGQANQLVADAFGDRTIARIAAILPAHIRKMER